MELPVIASDVGGIPEIVDNNTGILIPASNEKKIEEAIISLIINKDKRVEMGKSGRKKILKEFSLECMIRDWKKFYDCIFSSNH
jgi:glycosyltransferase involved in cell wall biosynthesis